MNVRKPKVVGPIIQDTQHDPTEAIGVGHLAALGSIPTISATGLSVGSTVAITAGSTDTAGEVSTTAAIAIGVGLVITVTYATPWANAPWVQLTAGSAVSVGNGYATSSATGFTITSTILLALGATAKWSYQVIGKAAG